MFMVNVGKIFHTRILWDSKSGLKPHFKQKAMRNRPLLHSPSIFSASLKGAPRSEPEARDGNSRGFLGWTAMSAWGLEP